MRLLAGDVGGTKTELGLFEVRDGAPPRELRTARFESAAYPGLGPVCADFLGAEPGPLHAAAFGVAGPVVDGECNTTNLPWHIRAAELSQALSAPVSLVNDFQAMTLGVHALPADALLEVQPGERDPAGHFAVIGAGTGLGVAIGVPDAHGVRVLSGEGGHVDFAPVDDEQAALLRFLTARHGHVSVERVVSGQGLHNIYEFVISQGLEPENERTRALLAEQDPGAVIGSLGARADDPACARALALFVRAYGAAAGNLALHVLPPGGVYIAGGIAPKLKDVLQRGEFLEAFLSKGRMRQVLSRVSLHLVLEARTGLLGALAAARILL